MREEKGKERRGKEGWKEERKDKRGMEEKKEEKRMKVREGER